LDAAYNGSLALAGVQLRARYKKVDTPLNLAPYGRPYTAGDRTIAHFLLIPEEGERPRKEIILEVACGPTRIYFRVYPIGEWWEYNLSGEVLWGREPYLCRIEPGAHGDVVQAGLGPVESLLCDCIFDKWTDRLLRLGADGERRIRRDRTTGTFSVETKVRAIFGSIPELLSAQVVENFIAEVRGMPYYKPYDRTHHPLPPSGWQSWYCYGRETSEEILVTIVDWLENNLKPFGCQVVQWDDGYQDESWLEWRKDLFPHGPKWIVDYVCSKGFTPGIWLVPQSLGNVDSKYLKTKPDWALIDPNTGEVFRRFGNYPYVDPTNPEVKREWFERIFRTMALEWGIGFFKLDGEGEMHQWYALCRDRMYDPSITPDEAYRGWLRIIREVIGPERTILICATQWRAMGLGDCCRTGTDVGESWPLVERALQATFSNYWMHTIAWYCDPDVLIVRPPLTLEQARAWASLLGLSGQVLLNSDPVHELPEERVELLRRVFPAQDIRPMDLWSRRPYGPYPQIWDLKVAKDWGSWDVVGIFRWFEENQAEVRITAEKLGLPPGRYVLYDFWGKTYLGELEQERSFVLEPGSCKVLYVRPLERLPLLLGTSRHITQGYPDLESLQYGEGSLEGESQLVAGDPYEIRILMKHGGIKYRCTRVTAEAAETRVRQEGPVLLLTLKSPCSRKVRWRVEFEPVPEGNGIITPLSR